MRRSQSCRVPVFPPHQGLILTSTVYRAWPQSRSHWQQQLCLLLNLCPYLSCSFTGEDIFLSDCSVELFALTWPVFKLSHSTSCFLSVVCAVSQSDTAIYIFVGLWDESRWLNVYRYTELMVGKEGRKRPPFIIITIVAKVIDRPLRSRKWGIVEGRTCREGQTGQVARYWPTRCSMPCMSYSV